MKRTRFSEEQIIGVLKEAEAAQLDGLSASGPGNGNTAVAALLFRFASPAASHDAAGSFTLTNHTDHSVGGGQVSDQIFSS